MVAVQFLTDKAGHDDSDNRRKELIEALRMLEETRDYLLRLPPVPVTTERIHKMSTFLNAPDNDLLIRRQVPRRGELVHPTGVILS